MPRPTGDDPAAAVAEALAPYDWRGLTDRMLARRVVGAVDRHTVVLFLRSMPGTDVGGFPPVEAAAADDERVARLTSALDGQQWRGWSLGRLCTGLLASLESWSADRESLESGLRRLLEGH